MTETGRWLSSGDSSVLAALAQAESDRSGVETFKRYLWQAKQAVRLWLSCLTESDELLYAVCEHVEDLTLVYGKKIRFLQLKTRDRGSWSASLMCDHGLDALVRSYKSARAAGILEAATFELWLEGPISDAKITVSFAESPIEADTSIRKKISGLGLKKEWIDDFLQRLAICPDQPTRAHIDAKVIYELGSVWQGSSQAELQTVYEHLLLAATAAQAAEPAPSSINAILAAARRQLAGQSHMPDRLDDPTLQPIRNQILTRQMLIELTPPKPGASADQLLVRVSAGTAASLLELKMRSAGASTKTIKRTKEIRADMEIQRQLLLASRDTAEKELDDLADLVLTVADATANRIALSAAGNPVAASRSAEAIAMDLLSRPADLAQCDTRELFQGNGRMIYGYLAHLSDECRFPWRTEE